MPCNNCIQAATGKPWHGYTMTCLPCCTRLVLSAQPSKGRGHAGGGSPFSRCPQTLRSLGVRAAGKRETPLSAAEIEHGVAHGLLGPGDGEEDDGQGFVRGDV